MGAVALGDPDTNFIRYVQYAVHLDGCVPTMVKTYHWRLRHLVKGIIVVLTTEMGPDSGGLTSG